MLINRIPIVSIKSENDTKPWLEVGIDPLGKALSIGEANYQKAKLGVRDSLHTINARIDDAKVDALEDGVDEIIIALRPDGSLHICSIARVESEYLAHLGFYHVSADELDLLQFVDYDTIHPDIEVPNDKPAV